MHIATYFGILSLTMPRSYAVTASNTSNNTTTMTTNIYVFNVQMTITLIRYRDG